MDVSAPASLTEPERKFLAELGARNVRYLVVGMSAALLQGARGATEDIDLWFESLADPGIAEAARAAGGFWITRTSPPMLGGMGDRFDVVTQPDGLSDFASEHAAGRSMDMDGIPVRVLPLRRIIASKRAAHRAKDEAVLHALESAASVLDALDARDPAAPWAASAFVAVAEDHAARDFGAAVTSPPGLAQNIGFTMRPDGVPVLVAALDRVDALLAVLTRADAVRRAHQLPWRSPLVLYVPADLVLDVPLPSGIEIRRLT